MSRSKTESFLKKTSHNKKVFILNLGCARNLVDAQVWGSLLKNKGYRVYEFDKKARGNVILNTCCFVEDAKKETIDALLDLMELKKKGQIKKLIVAGCFVKRYQKELLKEFKEIDALIGVLSLNNEGVVQSPFLMPAHYSYLKICESCYNHCSFCVIPSIKGNFISRNEKSILEEVAFLDQKGVKELNIVGQDITAYGMDIYKEKRLAKLLEKITAIVRNIRWIRLLYAFPAHITDELIDGIAKNEKICKYIDVPLQHINDTILKKMNRGISKEETIALIKKIRRQIPQAQLRTTFIVGFPGETEEMFQDLVDFVKETRFEKMGVFMYSKEEGTKAFSMPYQIDEETKKRRYDALMRVQQEISGVLQKKNMGKIIKVLIDEKLESEDNDYLGRSSYDAPEVDGVIYVHSKKKLKPGDFVDVKITDALEYDLAGEIV
ncbi:MAG TPA: 30S ribosomal protein S12 methylthiotransferase RimO [Candidatus Omnitrophota bacterium]|nr:30S ribosomal protein S12 methylthiotransferase RimO [Candidatus Omnitrophota bacterium]HPN88046.1 30S ribosomal protein S12 methylthiotransferase RimO [Candidatus Omnitrophota bacterium]